MLFSKEFLRDDRGNKETTVLDEIIDQTRWSTVNRRVFKHEGKFYETVYSYGSTESQDESPYEYDEDEIECKEVFEVQKLVTVYE